MSHALMEKSKGVLTPCPNVTERAACIRYGATFPMRGFRYLMQEPELFRWVLIPLVINITMIVFAYWGASWGAPRLLGELWAPPSGGFALTAWHAISMVVGLVIFAMSVVVLYVVSGVVGTPFYDYLTSQVERRLTGVAEAPVDWPQFWGDVSQSVRHSVLAFMVWIGVMTPLLCIGLVPGLGPIIEVSIGFLVTSLFLSREMMDGAMSRRRYSFVRKLAIVKRHAPVMIGFGGACTLLLWVPLLNFFFMPVAMVGGTLLFLMLESNFEK